MNAPFPAMGVQFAGEFTGYKSAGSTAPQLESG
jgi:hypothetical protein